MPRKILVADDNAINRQLLIHALSNEYDVIEAANGREALDLMNRNYKLLSAVLLDIMMPEMDGYDILRCVQGNPLLSQIPIIMVTGSVDESSRVKALSLGANDFILKPFNPDIVKHCLRNNIALRETASILNAIQRDKLTGLYNREAFFDKTGATLRERAPGDYVLACFDIDNFKLINDQYGAVEGDRILREIGVALKANADSMGGIAGRISADNFAVLLPADKDVDALRRVQSQRLASLDQRSVVFSIGCYRITDTALPTSAIYDRAYLAKQSVKGRYDKHIAYFDETMLEKLVRDQQIVGDMEPALAERQFEVWFQPQYNHVTGALIGAEALVRWRHPQKGMISPGEFIPLFEQNGFIYELDKYVWRETCRHLRKWLDEGFNPPPVSVNISRYDVFRADLIEVITGLLEEFHLPIELLRLEITESAFAKSTKLIVDIVKQLIALGFTLEIDDFGSGYSSLNTLKSVPAQVVKLDMRFLEGGDDAQRGGNILESIVRMTKWLGMSVIAEGVETREQGDFLKSIGCSHVQGYLYARPMPAGDYETHLRDDRREAGLPVLETAEHLDNDAFWNPTSMDSLIFNSYVGSACIYEYHDGRIEMLRATDKYARMLGGDGMTVEALLAMDLSRYLDKASAKETLDKLDASVRAKGEVTGEFLFVDLPGCPRETYIRSTMRVIASTESRYLVYCISENITAQRLSERKERETATRLQVILDNLNCGVTAVTFHSGIVTYLLANDKYYELLGYAREDFHQKVGESLDAIHTTVYPEDREHVAEVTQRTRETGKPASMEYRVMCSDGRVLWVRSYLSMARFEGVDEPVQMCTYADVTAERHTAQNLLDNLPCGAGICTVTQKDAYMTYLNRRYFTYFKHNGAELRDMSVFGLIHPDDRATLRKAMRPALGKGGVGSCVVRVKDGPDYLSFRLSGVAMESMGNANAIYVTFVPISHEELSFSEMLPMALRQMMATSTDLSFVKDRNLRYICCSRAFARMAGRKSEKDVIGRTDYDLFGKELADQYAAEDHHLMTSGESLVDQLDAVPMADGSTLYSNASKYPLYDSLGAPIGLYGTGYDVTGTRETEAQQRFVINNIPGGVAVYEGARDKLKEVRLAYFSDGLCRLFGYERDEYAALCERNAFGLVTEDSMPELMEQVRKLVQDGTPIDCVYRARVKDGALRWIHVKAVPGESRGKRLSVNALLFDVTQEQETLERLRVSEEENRLALHHGQSVVCRYDVATRSLKVSSNASPIYEVGPVIPDVPYGEVRNGSISTETAEAYTKFYEGILHGEKSGSVVYQRKSSEGWRWLKANFSAIFSVSGAPVSAVISFFDVTDSFEKDIAYEKWMQSLHHKDANSYSLFRCNVSKEMVFDSAEGTLLSIRFKPGPFSFDEHTEEYIAQCVWSEDAERFRAFLSVDALLKKYRRGERILALEYRERLAAGDFRWLRLTVDLVEYPHTGDVEAYLLFENIDEAKRAELLTLERAETDPLTGVLNRTAFAEKVDARIRASGPKALHALLMLDIDGFKLVNDAFGHGTGDQTLIDVAARLRSALRHDDLIGRLGGDEFVAFLTDIPGERVAADKARQICDLCRKAISAEVRISASIGVAMHPRDGASFEALYQRADETLYHVKETGRDSFAFYHEGMKDERVLPGQGAEAARKRRMLIVDDSKIDYELLAHIFRRDFDVEQAKDGNEALVRLRYFGSAISVVLLDLMMPGMDGFAVLEKMRQSPETRAVPVVVVSGADDRETSLRAIRDGASDFVMKPVDSDVLRIRVQSAISKAENERLRVQNGFLELQSAEMLRYRTVLDEMGLAVAELDWNAGAFAYGPAFATRLAGRYDERDLWKILLSDGVADAETVGALRQLARDAVDGRTTDGARALLQTPSGRKEWFLVHAYRLPNGPKIILTFQEIEREAKTTDTGEERK